MNSRLGWTFAITSLALFAFTLDRLVVAIALPAIRTDLGAPVAGLEWTVNAYTLSFAVLLLTGGALGALGDRFGRRARPPARPRPSASWRWWPGWPCWGWSSPRTAATRRARTSPPASCRRCGSPRRWPRPEC
jgi:MFS family permease